MFGNKFFLKEFIVNFFPFPFQKEASPISRYRKTHLFTMGVPPSQCVIYMLVLVTFIEATAILSKVQDTADPRNPTDRRNPQWAQKLLDSISARDSVIPNINAFVQEVTSQSIKNLIGSLDAVSSQLKGLDNLTFTTQEEQSGTLATEIKDQPENSLVMNWFRSNNLESHYTTQGFGFVLKTMKNSLSPSQPFTGRDLPLTQMCVHVEEDIGKRDRYTFSTDKICKNVNQCSGTETPNPYNDADGTNVQEACSKDTNACDITKAVPMMGALLWYKVSDFIALGFCHNHLEEPEKSIIQTKHEEVQRMANLISAYISTLNFWRDFFDQVAEARAFSDLPPAMTLVEQREKSFKFASLACLELNANDMCTVGDIFNYYESLKKLRKD